MMKWTLACGVVVVVGFLAVPAQAQPAAQTTTPNVVTVSPSTSSGPRLGLLRRLRERRGTQMTTTTTTQPATQLKSMPTQTTPTPKVTQAQATEVAPAQTTQVAEGRQGILSRLRSRIGR